MADELQSFRRTALRQSFKTHVIKHGDLQDGTSKTIYKLFDDIMTEHYAGKRSIHVDEKIEHLLTKDKEVIRMITILDNMEERRKELPRVETELIEQLAKAFMQAMKQAEVPLK